MKTDFLFSVTPGGVSEIKKLFIHSGGLSENGGGGGANEIFTPGPKKLP